MSWRDTQSDDEKMVARAGLLSTMIQSLNKFRLEPESSPMFNRRIRLSGDIELFDSKLERELIEELNQVMRVVLDKHIEKYIAELKAITTAEGK